MMNSTITHKTNKRKWSIKHEEQGGTGTFIDGSGGGESETGWVDSVALRMKWFVLGGMVSR